MNGLDRLAPGADEFRWCVVAGTLLLGLAISTLSGNGGSLNITPNGLSLNVNRRRESSDRGPETDVPAPPKETFDSGEPTE